MFILALAPILAPSSQELLDRAEALLERLEATRKLVSRRLTAARQARARTLSPARELLAGIASAASDVVE